MESLDSVAELGRLKAQVELVRTMEDDFLRNAGLAPADWLLDVGCGPGFFAERAARDLVSEGRVTGVDVDVSLLDLGRERLRESGLSVELVPGTGARLPLADDSVDFCYARFLFQHLSDPMQVLGEMVRVTRPGGTVAVTDTDDGSLVVHPAPEGLERLLDASRQAQTARGGDRTIGRRLKALLTEAGLEGCGIQVHPLTTEEVPPELFVRMTLGFKSGVIDEPFMPREEAAQVVQQLLQLSSSPAFFGHALGYGAWGRVSSS